MKVRFIDYVGNPGGGIMLGTSLFLALQRLRPAVQFEFVSYGPAFLRYRRAFAEQNAPVALRAVAPCAYWRNAASSLIARAGLGRLGPRSGGLMRWSFATPPAAIAGCDAIVFPWAHRHIPPPGGMRVVAGLMDITCLLTAPAPCDPVAQSWRANERRNLSAWLASGHRLAAISETTASLIGQHLGIAPERIRIIPIVGKDGDPAAPWPTAWRWGAAPYLFYPANLSPHKNHEALFKAFQLAQPGFTLVLSGSDASLPAGRARRLTERQRALVDYAGKCGLVPGQTLISLGYISAREYQALLARARALIMPSLMEGYGLPIDEALRAGIPVLCSDIPVFREVVKLAGGDAVWFDPAKPADIARALLALREDYAELKRRAVVQMPDARRRTWEEVASKYWELLMQN